VRKSNLKPRRWRKWQPHGSENVLDDHRAELIPAGDVYGKPNEEVDRKEGCLNDLKPLWRAAANVSRHSEARHGLDDET
jgi:hypothetical protein